MNAVIKQLHDAPTAPGSKVVEYSRTEVALADLRARFSNVVFDVKTTSGDKDARVARAEIKGYRTALETMRVDLTAPLLERQRLIKQEATRITAELIALEEPIDAQIKLEEKRKADEKAARELADKVRIADIRRKLDELRAIPVGLIDATPEQMANTITDLEEFRATREVFGEFADEAHAACTDALMKVSEMRTAAIRRAEEAAQLAAERAALAKQRAEQDERERVVAMERAEQQRKDMEAYEAEQAELRAAQAKAEAAMRAEREAHEAKMAAERAQIERQQAEIAAEQRRKQKEIDDAQAIAQAEIARQQAALDADRQRIADEAAARQREADEAAAAAQREREAELEREWLEAKARVDAENAAQAERERAEADRKRAEQAAREAADTAIRNAAQAPVRRARKDARLLRRRPALVSVHQRSSHRSSTRRYRPRPLGRSAGGSMSEFYVVAVCHTNRGHEYVTLWRPDDCGYTPVLPRAGKYDYERVMSHMDYYNGGEHIAIRAHVLDAIAEPIPDGFFDYAGPGIANTKENWEAIKAAIAWPTKYPVRPDWYGKRGRRPS